MSFFKSIRYEHVIIIIISGILIGGILTQPPPQESFTELYFTNPSNLQREVGLNEPLNITFTVKNHEYRDLHYSYELSLEYEQNRPISKKISVTSGKFFLLNNESIEISEEIGVKEIITNPVRVSVLLFKDGSNDTYRNLHYWINTTVG